MGNNLRTIERPAKNGTKPTAETPTLTPAELQELHSAFVAQDARRIEAESAAARLQAAVADTRAVAFRLMAVKGISPELYHLMRLPDGRVEFQPRQTAA